MEWQLDEAAGLSRGVNTEGTLPWVGRERACRPPAVARIKVVHY